MKKVLLTLALLTITTFASFANTEEEFTWARYEVLCMKFNITPSWEHYEYLYNNPQCFPTIDESETLKLFEGVEK